MSIIRRLIGRDPTPWIVGPPLLSILASNLSDPNCVLPDVERSEHFSFSGTDRYEFLHQIRNVLSMTLVEPRSPELTELRHALAVLMAEPLNSACPGHTHYAARAGLYRLVRQPIAPPIRVALYEDMRAGRIGCRERICEEGVWLANHAAHREAVWFAIAMLTACGRAEHVDLLEILSRHSAFHVPALRAAAACLGDPLALWDRLRDQVGFLRRLTLVRLMTAHAAARPDIQLWLLRHGCRESNNPTLVALDCAQAGDLAGALRADILDAALLDGACLLLRTMLKQEQQNRIESRLRDYPQALSAIERLLHHLAAQTDSLQRLETVFVIKDWLYRVQEEETYGPQNSGTSLNNEDYLESRKTNPYPNQETLFGWSDASISFNSVQEKEPGRSKNYGMWTQRGLDQTKRRILFAICERIIAQPGWPHVIRQQRAKGDAVESLLAWQLAVRYRLDLWPDVFKQLQTDPINPLLYRDACDTASPQRLQQVLEQAEHHLPLSQIGAGDCSAFPKIHDASKIHDERETQPISVTEDEGLTENILLCLGYLLRAMERHQILQRFLVKATLRSPTTRHRLAAVRVLSHHPWWEWGEDVQEALRHCLAYEPDEMIRETIYRAAIPADQHQKASGLMDFPTAEPSGMLRLFNGGRRQWRKRRGWS